MSPSSFPPQAPSSGRPLPICRVPWGKFPDLTGTISRLRLLAPRRASLRFLRSALPPLRPLRSPGAGRFPRGPGPLLPRRPRRLCTVEKTRPPRFLGDPCIHAPLFDPGGPPVPGHYRTGDVVFRTLKDVDSALPISRLNHAACTLSVYASQPGSPPDHATLDSGRWPALTGQDFHLLGRVEGFRHVYPSTWLPPSPSFAWRISDLDPISRKPYGPAADKGCIERPDIRRYLTHMPPFVQSRACQSGGRPHTVRTAHLAFGRSA